MMDNRTGASIILMAFIEIITLGWFYGVGRYWENIVEMGMRIPTVMKYYWIITWKFITPLICLVVIIKVSLTLRSTIVFILLLLHLVMGFIRKDLTQQQYIFWIRRCRGCK